MRLFLKLEFYMVFLIYSSTVSLAEERPDEAAMFGSPEASSPLNSVPRLSATPNANSEALSSTLPVRPERDAFATGEVSENPLQIGGVFYQRMTLSPQEGGSFGNAPMSAPLQVDGFFDARPSENLRAFIRPRLLYDPTRDSYSNATSGSGVLGNNLTASTSTAPSSLSGSSGTTPIPNNPQVVLDQAWLTFNIEQKVFVTLGKQHVRWGASRFWNPTDFLHTQRRDPLLTTDVRFGNMMAKFQFPTGRMGTNLYAIALMDNPLPASTLGQLGGAFRAETLIGTAEVGAEAIYRGNSTPTYGADISAPVGPIDIYAEAALRTEPMVPSYQLNSSLTTGTDIASAVSLTNNTGPFIQVSGGMKYSFAWAESRQATLGMEYFYNQLGYDRSSIYPALIFLGAFQPFYMGKNYASFYISAEGPDEGKRTNYTFSTLGNLSDNSFISRLDFSWRVLVYLTFEAYGDVHYGSQGGEFNFSINTPLLTNRATVIPPIKSAATIFDIGIGFRMSL
ncbi:MAG: DUF1302 family protein [Bdellovibrionia bacterium]